MKLLPEAWAATDAPLVTNQCEYHPYLNQDKLRAACFERGMIFTAFSPLGRRVVLEDPVIVAIAEGKGRTPAQVVLRWSHSAGKHRRYPEEQQPGSHPLELRDLRLHAR